MAWLKIRQKLFFGFLAVTVLIIIFGYIAGKLNRSISHDINQLNKGSLIESIHAMDLLLAVQGTHSAAQERIEELLVEKYLGPMNPVRLKLARQQSQLAKKLIYERLDDCKEHIKKSKNATEMSMQLADNGGFFQKHRQEQEEIRRWHTRVEQKISAYREIMVKFLALSDKESLTDAVDFLEYTLEPQSFHIINLVKEFRDDTKEELDEEVGRIRKNISVSNTIIIISIVISIVIAVIVSFLISGNISKPIVRLKEFAVNIGKGFFDERIEIKSRDEIGVLTREFNDMAARLKEKTSQLEEAKAKLEQQNVLLEEKVEERTGELSESNKQLQKEIEERKRAEEKTSRSLQEKELLLKEVHHRVKNNLQIICSLLNLQAESAGSPEVMKVLEESQDRIRSMAMIHEILYNSEDFSKINFGEYLDQLTGYLADSYKNGNVHIHTEVNAGDVFLELGKAISCGLIVSELYVNSLKYAFHGDTAGGGIWIDLYKEGNDRYILKFRDNGRGFPRDFSLEEPKGFGLQLVLSLTQQLGGSIELDQTDGSMFLVNFPS